jgi:hypothetical protein
MLRSHCRCILRFNDFGLSGLLKSRMALRASFIDMRILTLRESLAVILAVRRVIATQHRLLLLVVQLLNCL